MKNTELSRIYWFLFLVAATTLITSLASWIPATIAASQDPALVLSQD